MIEYKSYWLLSGETKKNPVDKGGLKVRCVIPNAEVCLKVDGKENEGIALGKNSLDALFKAFCQAVGGGINLKKYQIWENFQEGNIKKSFRGGNPISRAIVQISANKKDGIGVGDDKDSGKAFLLALVDAVNQIRFKKHKEENNESL